MNNLSSESNNQDMTSLMNNRIFLPLPEKLNKFSTNQQESLLGLASTLFQGEMRSFPAMSMANLFPQRNTRPEDITSQVLAELADDSFFDPPTDDIFDMEPVPIQEPPSQHVHHLQQHQQQHQHHHQQQQQQQSLPSPGPITLTAPVTGTQNRLSVLEDTLNQVLSIDDAFVVDEKSMTSTNNGTGPLPVALAPTSKHFLESEPLPSCKRQRMTLEEEEDAARRFRPYQAEQWTEKFEELLQFRKERGHCCVPHTFDENPSLARWVKRQRYQYKLKAEGKPSTMTDERIVALEQAGFVWDSHGAAWLERWQELVQFQQEFGHANVPSNHPQNPQLATWVKCQRRQYKLFWDGKPSNMSLERIQRLESVGFEWELRMSHKKK